MSKAVRITGFILSLVCLGAIVYLSLCRGVSVPGFILGEDKGAHFLAYVALSFLFMVSMARYPRHRVLRRNLLSMLGAFGLSFLCGYTIELIQPAFRRSFELLDLAADALGSFSGVVLGFVCVFCVTIIERKTDSK